MDELHLIQTQLQSVITKVDMINPALFLEFKGTVVETLKTFDRDIDELKKTIELLREQVITNADKKNISNTLQISDISKEVKKLSEAQAADHTELFMTKAKITIYTSIISTIAVLIIEAILHWAIK